MFKIIKACYSIYEEDFDTNRYIFTKLLLSKNFK